MFKEKDCEHVFKSLNTVLNTNCTFISFLQFNNHLNKECGSSLPRIKTPIQQSYTQSYMYRYLAELNPTVPHKLNICNLVQMIL